MNKRKFLVFALGLGLIIGVLVACGAASNTTSSVENSKPDTKASTPTAAPAPKTFKIGQTVNVGGIWDITVNSGKTNPGTQYITPTKGTFFLVDVTVKNISGQAQPISSIITSSCKMQAAFHMMRHMLILRSLIHRMALYRLEH